MATQPKKMLKLLNYKLVHLTEPLKKTKLASKLTRKNKVFISVATVAILLISFFAFLPKGNQTPTPIVPVNTTAPTDSPTDTPQATPKPTTTDDNPFSSLIRFINDPGGALAPPPKAPGIIQVAGGMNSTVWHMVANISWQYFQPGVGVDGNTGLPNSGIGVSCFTDWDLGVYIQAVLDAAKVGAVSADGDWGYSARLEKVVHWLEIRDLNKYGYPFWFYQSTDGKNYKQISDAATTPVDGVDTGRLFVALNNMKIFNSTLTSRIDGIVKTGRSDFHSLVQSVKDQSLYSTSIYAYYTTAGYQAFWPTELSGADNQILSNMMKGNVTTPEGVVLPAADILGDPLICSVFETPYNALVMNITRQVYFAHEAYYNVTGKYRAFSEGSSPSTHWAYEWVALADGRTWTVLDESYNNYPITPIIYTKIAMSFLALYNTTYAYNMAVYLEKTTPDPSTGYSEGVDEGGYVLGGTGLNTNGMIIGAADYAIRNSS